jgi:hypothetical protein
MRHAVGPLPRCEDASYFIDADGTLFGWIVNALRRNGEVSLPDAPGPPRCGRSQSKRSALG